MKTHFTAKAVFSLCLATVSLATIAVSAAEARPLSTRMYCDDVRTMVNRNGAVVVGYTTHTYDRIVRDQSFCMPTETTELINVPTLDTPYCPAGFLCRERGRFRNR